LHAVFEETRLLLGTDDEAAWETVQNAKSLAGDYLPAPRADVSAGWVSPEDHARVVALTADEAQKHARDIAAERDAALAVKAQLLAALEDARILLGDDDVGAAIDTMIDAIAAAKGGAT
jgi:hypothetical protein